MNSMRTNVIFFEPSSGFGGSGSALFNLLNYLDRKKYSPIVIITSDGPQFEKIKTLGINTIKVNLREDFAKNRMLSLLRSFYTCLENTLRLIRVVRKTMPEVVHINTNIISAMPMILVSKILGVPCVCHIRQTRPLVRREKIFIKRINSFIVINKMAEVMYSKDIPAEKVNLIYDGVDLLAVNDSKSTDILKKRFNLEGSVCVGIVGRLIEGKGYDEFIKAAAVVVKEEKKLNIKFCIIGSDPDHKKPVETRLRSITESLGLNDHIVFMGWQSDVLAAISLFDISVQPYTSPEGLPNVIIEAMALGKPVITTDIPGPSDIVVNGETGFLVPPADPKALAEAILKLLSDADLAKRMGANGRKRVEELFDVRKTVKSIENIYDELLSKK